MLDNLSRIAGQAQVESMLQRALDEHSINSARPMDDAEIEILTKTLRLKIRTGELSSDSDFIKTIIEMSNLIMRPADGIPGPEYIFWARKMLRRFQELFMVFYDSDELELVH